MRCAFGSHVFSWNSAEGDGGPPEGAVCMCGGQRFHADGVVQTQETAERRYRSGLGGLCRHCGKALDDHRLMRFCE